MIITYIAYTSLSLLQIRIFFNTFSDVFFWMNSNKILLNPSKIEFFFIGIKQQQQPKFSQLTTCLLFSRQQFQRRRHSRKGGSTLTGEIQYSLLHNPDRNLQRRTDQRLLKMWRPSTLVFIMEQYYAHLPGIALETPPLIVFKIICVSSYPLLWSLLSASFQLGSFCAISGVFRAIGLWPP